MVVYDFFIALGFNPVVNQTVMALLVVFVFFVEYNRYYNSYFRVRRS